MIESNFRGKVVTIFGGTGFVGRYCIAELAKLGATVKVATRHPSSAYFLRTLGTPGQIVPVLCRYSNPDEIKTMVSGSDFVINCLGILTEGGKTSSFARLHTDIPRWIAEACRLNNIQRFVHISALGVDKAKSKYAVTKILGEKAVTDNFPSVTILRPSVIFGAEDNFFNMFAKLAMCLPVLPLIGGGKTRFQPVYVVDVAQSVVHALGDIRTCGQVYELGGPEILSFREIYERLFTYINRQRMLVTLPWGIARIQAFFMGILPNPPLTNDQITSLQTDSVVSDNSLGLNDLGITPTALDAVVPLYLRYTHHQKRKIAS